MKIRTLIINNYGPFYGSFNITLSDQGLVLVQGDNQDEPRMNSNGSGKSHIFDALDWVLFGVSPRGDHADAIINDLAALEKKGCSVFVSVEGDNGVEAVIERGRGKKNYLSFKVNGEDQTTLDTKETQKKIENFLGVDRKVFHAAVLFSQTDLVRYADSTDSKRMEILTQILQLEEIDVYLAKVRKMVKRVEVDLQTTVQERIKVEGQIEAVEQQDQSQQLESWEVTRQQRLVSKQAEIHTVEKTIDQLIDETQAFGDIDRQRAQLRAEVDQLDAGVRVAQSEPNTLADGLEKEIQELQIDLGGIFANIKSREAHLNQVADGLCPHCRQGITHDHRDTLRFDLGAEIQQLQVNYQYQESVIQQRQAELEQAKQGRKEYIQQLRDALHQKVEAGKQFELVWYNLSLKCQDLGNKRNEWARLQKEHKQILEEVNPYAQQQNSVLNQVESLEIELARLKPQEVEISQNLADLNFWKDAFSAKGLKSYILDSRLQELTDAVNQWIGLLTGGTFWVKFDSQKKTRGNKLVNAPNLVICRWNKDGTITERDYKSWSGGQKQRISFAVDFGLSRLVANRANHRYGLLILDEVFKHLDDSGKEAVLEMLTLLEREKDSVWVVEHDSSIASHFEKVIKVVMKDCKARLESGHVSKEKT